MDVYHRVAFSPYRSPELQQVVGSLGIPYHTLPGPDSKVGLIYLDIYESDPAWPELAKALEKWQAVDRYDTIFTEEEILAAEWVRLVPVHESGYLKPETPKWRFLIYEKYCEGCGAYEHQKGLIRMAKEPSRPRGSFVAPIGPYVLFCSPDMEQEIRESGIQGYEVWPVLEHRTGKPFAHTVQIYVREVANPGLTRAEELRPTRCEVCGRTKYRPHMRGVMYLQREAFKGKEGVDILHSYEWFGSGHAAYREIIISNRFARLILEKGWKGVRMKVIEVV